MAPLVGTGSLCFGKCGPVSGCISRMRPFHLPLPGLSQVRRFAFEWFPPPFLCDLVSGCISRMRLFHLPSPNWVRWGDSSILSDFPPPFLCDSSRSICSPWVLWLLDFVPDDARSHFSFDSVEFFCSYLCVLNVQIHVSLVVCS